MTEQDLAIIETTLNVRLPQDYREFLLSIAQRRRGLSDEQNGGNVGREASDVFYGFFTNPENVIEESRYPLESGLIEGQEWEAAYVGIAHSGSGDLYFIDTALDASPVFLLSHEDASIELEYDSLSACLEDFERVAAESAATEEVRQQAEAETRRRFGYLACCVWICVIVGILLAILIGKYHRGDLRAHQLVSSSALLR